MMSTINVNVLKHNYGAGHECVNFMYVLLICGLPTLQNAVQRLQHPCVCLISLKQINFQLVHISLHLKFGNLPLPNVSKYIQSQSAIFITNSAVHKCQVFKIHPKLQQGVVLKKITLMFCIP